ncbi:MAG: DeoR/GlpR transcriptional regulator [Lachnospiraceae bacterium]|nr:DeoR/GlpR transcriptional regulator [Lachnospiraceae bacterium]
MLMEERQLKIAELIEKKGHTTIAELTKLFDISHESARRDLRILESKGLCKRTHGGALKPMPAGFMPPRNRNFDEMPVFENYEQIAKQAVTHIKENQIIYLTGGSFGFHMCHYLPRDIHYTLVVNSIDLANRLRHLTNADLYVVGGKMRQSTSVVDSMATDFVSRMHFDLCFITGSGITAEFGLSNGTDETATFQRKVIENRRKKILLLPSQKIGTDAFIKVCDAEKFDLLITDWDCVEEEITKIEEKGVEVMLVEPNPNRTEQPRERKDDANESNPDQRTEASESDS